MVQEHLSYALEKQLSADFETRVKINLELHGLEYFALELYDLIVDLVVHAQNRRLQIHHYYHLHFIINAFVLCVPVLRQCVFLARVIIHLVLQATLVELDGERKTYHGG